MNSNSKERARRLHSTLLSLVFGSIAIFLPAVSARSDSSRPAPDPVDVVVEVEVEVEEMLVLGDPRPSMDVLAGASISRIETDLRLIEGAQIDDLLAEMPGVQIRRYGGVGERFEISIRGSRPEQVPVFLDGVRLDTSLTGRSDLSTLCLDALQEIQVTRGAGAARAGSGAIGGVVNLVSRAAGDEPETRLRISGGSFDSIEGSVRHSRRVRDWDLSLSYCGFRTDGDFRFQQPIQKIGGVSIGSSETVKRVNNDSERHTGLARIGRRVGEGQFRITQLFSDLDRGSPGFGSVEPAQRLEAREKNQSSLTSLAFDHPISQLPTGRFEFILSHRFESNSFEDEPLGPASDAVDIRTDVHNSTLRMNLSVDGDALSAHHRFSLLGEGRFDLRQSNETHSKSRAGIAIRVELESSWWDRRFSLSPSLRLERFGGLDVEWIPGILVRAEPLDWIEIRAALARSYRVPSFQELFLPDKGYERGNPNLRPEEAWSVEVGATLRSPFESPWLDGEIEATWFAGEIENTIAFQLIGSNVSAPVNTGRSDTRGYELLLRWSPHPWFRTTATRTVTRAKLEDTGARVAGVAYSQTDARIEVGPRDRWKIVGEIHYIGRLPVSADAAASLPPRTSYDASASLDLTRVSLLHLSKFGRSLWLSVRGRNLGNVAIRDSRFFPRPGRNFSIALESVF